MARQTNQLTGKKGDVLNRNETYPTMGWAGITLSSFKDFDDDDATMATVTSCK